MRWVKLAGLCKALCPCTSSSTPLESWPWAASFLNFMPPELMCAGGGLSAGRGCSPGGSHLPSSRALDPCMQEHTVLDPSMGCIIWLVCSRAGGMCSQGTCCVGGGRHESQPLRGLRPCLCQHISDSALPSLPCAYTGPCCQHPLWHRHCPAQHSDHRSE